MDKKEEALVLKVSKLEEKLKDAKDKLQAYKREISAKRKQPPKAKAKSVKPLSATQLKLENDIINILKYVVKKIKLDGADYDKISPSFIKEGFGVMMKNIANKDSLRVFGKSLKPLYLTDISRTRLSQSSGGYVKMDGHFLIIANEELKQHLIDTLLFIGEEDIHKINRIMNGVVV